MAMTCFTDWKYLKFYKHNQAVNLLKHLERREGTYYPDGDPSPWLDYGLGETIEDIIDSLEELCSRHVLLWSLVIRPPQRLIARLKTADPERWTDRFHLMQELVYRVMKAEMERSWREMRYSFVIHTHPDKDGVESPHAHVIIAGSEDMSMNPFSVYRADVLLTRAVAERETENLFALDRFRQEQAQPAAPQQTEPLEAEDAIDWARGDECADLPMLDFDRPGDGLAEARELSFWDEPGDGTEPGTLEGDCDYS